MEASQTLFSFEGAGPAVGVNDGEGPPVPIPNTEVKLTGAEDTCLATDRENRAMPTQRRCCLESLGAARFASSRPDACR